MLKSEIRAINKTASMRTIGMLIFVNIILFGVYYSTMHVVQSDFSKLGADKLKSEIQRIGYGIPKRACLVIDGLSPKAKAKVEAEVGIEAVSKCSTQCGSCFTVSENASAVKQKATITVKDDENGMMNIQVVLKNESKLPRDFGRIFQRLAAQSDSINENEVIESPTLSQVKSIEISHFKLIDDVSEKNG